MDYNFLEILETETIKRLLASLKTYTNIPLTIIDARGNFIFETGCSKICEKFYKNNEVTSNMCIESYSDCLRNSNDKNYLITKCRNGLNQIIIPIVENNKRVGTVILEQFLIDENQSSDILIKADEHGFLIKEFKDALKEVPLYKEEEIFSLVELIIDIKNVLIDFIKEKQNSENSYKELKLKNYLLDRVEKTQKLLLDTSHAGLYDLNIVTGELFLSSTWKEILGYNKEYHLNHIDDWLEMIHPNKRQVIKTTIDNNFKSCKENYYSEYMIKNSREQFIWIKDKGIIVRDDNEFAIRAVGSIMDITENKMFEKALYDASFFDYLTALPNISYFKRTLEQSFEKLISGVVYYIDLDDFKKVNDLVGHKLGDELLILVSEKLKSIFNSYDFICRFGGDEFLVLQENVTDKNMVEKTADKIKKAFKESIELNGLKFHVTASIGITFFPEQSLDVNEVLKNADTAVNKAKRKGKNNYEFYESEMFSEILNRSEIEKYLREALHRNEFNLNYQPIVDVKTGEIRSFEALIRWTNPKLGFVSPSEFIPIAEETGLIIDIGNWVMEKVCYQIKEWEKQGYEFEYVSINVSELQFQQDDFVNIVRKTIENNSIDAKHLALEITESMMIKSMEKNIELLKELNFWGIRTMLDDFGTGYSSLNYLMKIPINTLKIDKSFIDNICGNLKQEAITEGIILLAHKIDLEVIAEGVEEEDQKNILLQKKCDKIQGYLYSKPVSGEVADNMLKAKRVI
ncbi:EAL domain-containing protein [Clostridium grantii]|uniref:PAS domain S-box-containing protein/diguanylate cyclase (GGDEF) domain-containing protein n=1 Tax=Clostridium grantii DSM 8605 TaxID=1121316 RepID=A0A1M5RTK1_9CLOT|nr:EAL domain-containing protein [Clostridium grantii]SHH29625.1 PAS domain S-box-containing protein/diguanylate cyclase (GGDEF) domain-containing protein [Clostridium grantii DSM 8605]